jgi:integrase
MARPNKGPKLEQHANGYFYIHATVNGKSRPQSTKTSDRKEANKIFAAYLLSDEKLATAAASADDVKLRTAAWCIAQYVKFQADKISRPEPVKVILQRFADFFGPEKMVKDIGPEDFAAYYTERKAAPRLHRKSKKPLKDQRPIADGSIKNEWSIFKAALNYCVKHRLLSSDVLPVWIIPEASPGRTRHLSEDEIRLMLAITQTTQPQQRKEDYAEWQCGLTQLHLFTCIGLATGRRKNAIETLHWYQVNFKKREINFLPEGRKETSKRRGTARISAWLLPRLEQAYRERVNDYVLGGPFNLGSNFTRYARKAGLTGVSPHVLRHTYVSRALANGYSLWQVSHALSCTVETLEKVYGHSTGEDRATVTESVMPADFDMPQTTKRAA